jgi:hypothetical protein
LSSIFNANTSLLGIACATGNCSWPTTPTIGVCSSCTDVRNKMTKTNVSLPLVEDPTNPSNLTQEQFVQYSLSYADMLFEPFDLSPEPASIRFGHHSITYGNTNLSTIVQGTYSNSTPAGQLPISQFFMLGIPPTSFAAFLAAYTLEGQIYTLSPAKLDPLVVAYNCSFSFVSRPSRRRP